MKASKMQAGYTPITTKDFCRDCAHFLLGNRCSKVMGAVEAGGSCSAFFEPIKKATKTPTRSR